MATHPDLVAPGISRRRVLQGAAWATPAVIVATALPAAAGSPEPAGEITFGTGQVQRGDNGGPSTFDIQNLPVIYTGTGYVATLSLTLLFPRDAVTLPPVVTTSSNYGWQISANDSGSGPVEFVFAKDPGVSFQYYIPPIQGWIEAAATATAALNVPVLVSGLNNEGDAITATNLVVSFPAL